MEPEWTIGGKSMDDKKQKLEEKKIKELVEGMLNTDGVDKLISPNSDEYLLIDTSNEMVLCLEHTYVKVMNHKYLLSIKTRLRFTEDLKKLVKDKLELERQILKKSLFKNEIDLISKLAENYK